MSVKSATQRPLDTGLIGYVSTIIYLSFPITSTVLVPDYPQMHKHQLAPRIFCNKTVSSLYRILGITNEGKAESEESMAVNA